MSYNERKQFQGISSGAGGLDRPTFKLGVQGGGDVNLIAILGGGPFSVTSMDDIEFRERIDTYAGTQEYFTTYRTGTAAREAAVRRLIEIGLAKCEEADYINAEIERQKEVGQL